jgi:hypothetical protein
MRSAALLRREIEDAFQDRFPAALTPAPRAVREVAATGIAPVDELLDGGLPVGAISELTGPVSSGRTSLAVAFLARRTAEGRVCAWVDVADIFDPESAAAGGVALRQLLWVRCREAKPRIGSSVQRRAGAEARADFASLTGPAEAVPLLQNHLQSRLSVVSEAVPLQNCVHEAVPFQNRVREAVPLQYLAPEAMPHQKKAYALRSQSQVWPRLDQALRSTDLLLQAGGFAAIVLDLGSTAREDAIRIPLATWFRFRQAADRTRCSLIVLARAAVAQSSAALVLECSRRRSAIAGGTVLEGFEFAVERGRMRATSMSTCKPPLSTWTATPAQDAKRCA